MNERPEVTFVGLTDPHDQVDHRMAIRRDTLVDEMRIMEMLAFVNDVGQLRMGHTEGFNAKPVSNSTLLLMRKRRPM